MSVCARPISAFLLLCQLLCWPVSVLLHAHHCPLKAVAGEATLHSCCRHAHSHSAHQSGSNGDQTQVPTTSGEKSPDRSGSGCPDSGGDCAVCQVLFQPITTSQLVILQSVERLPEQSHEVPSQDYPCVAVSCLRNRGPPQFVSSV